MKCIQSNIKIASAITLLKNSDEKILMNLTVTQKCEKNCLLKFTVLYELDSFGTWDKGNIFKGFIMINKLSNPLIIQPCNFIVTYGQLHLTHQHYRNIKREVINILKCSSSKK